MGPIIYFMGAVSGAHLNPAVTLAFAIRRNFPWNRVPGYVLGQAGSRLTTAAGPCAAGALYQPCFEAIPFAISDFNANSAQDHRPELLGCQSLPAVAASDDRRSWSCHSTHFAFSVSRSLRI